MALIKCSECGAEISDKATECPKCGCPVEVSAATETAENKKKGLVKLIIIIALMPCLWDGQSVPRRKWICAGKILNCLFLRTLYRRGMPDG